jgi:hypothetical protein
MVRCWKAALQILLVGDATAALMIGAMATTAGAASAATTIDTHSAGVVRGLKEGQVLNRVRS